MSDAALRSEQLSMMPETLSPASLAMGASSSRFDEMDTIVEKLWNPYECPSVWLPWLAETMSVDFWDEDWPERKKRNVIANQLNLEKKKGTVFALRAYSDLAGASIDNIIRPPQRVFSGANQTPQERERWLSGLPQVRVFLPRRSKIQKHQLRSGGALRPSFFEMSFPVPTEPTKREAVYLDDNQNEVNARVEELGSYYRLHFPSVRKHGVFSGDICDRNYFVPSTAVKRIFTIAPEEKLPSRSPVGPSIKAVTAEPERISENYTRNSFQTFSGDKLGTQFFVPSNANERIYDRWSLLLGDRAIKRSVNRMSCQFMGVGFYSWPRHHMRIQTTIKGTSMHLRAGSKFFVPHSRFWVPTNKKPLQLLRRALGTAKSARDSINIQLGTSATLAIGRPLIAGTSLIVGRP